LTPFKNRQNLDYKQLSILNEVRFPGGAREIFPLPPRPDQLWSPHSLLSKGYRGSYPGG